MGAGLFAVDNNHINWGIEALSHGQLQGVIKVLAGLFVSPFLGFIVGFIIMKGLFYVLGFFNHRIRGVLLLSQYFSVAWLGFSHGANDAQKGMAIIGMMLLASHQTTSFIIPTWAILLCSTAITLGTAMGGWSIVKTLGFGLYRIHLPHSVANQLGSALVNSFATSMGAPTSTTQVVTATLLGNVSAEKPAHVRWQTASNIMKGWIFNVPISIILGWLFCWVLAMLFQ